MIFKEVLAATIAATPQATPGTGGAPVTGNMEMTILLLLGAVVFLISGSKFLLKNSS